MVKFNLARQQVSGLVDASEHVPLSSIQPKQSQ